MSNHAFLKYIKNVLGVRQIVHEPRERQSSPQSDHCKVSFVFERELETEAAKEIFQKMTKAMGLKPDDFEQTKNIENARSPVVVHFTVDGKTKKSLTPTSVVTYDPETLHKNPEKKKQTWTELQRVMKWYN